MSFWVLLLFEFLVLSQFEFVSCHILSFRVLFLFEFCVENNLWKEMFGDIFCVKLFFLKKKFLCETIFYVKIFLWNYFLHIKYFFLWEKVLVFELFLKKKFFGIKVFFCDKSCLGYFYFGEISSSVNKVCWWKKFCAKKNLYSFSFFFTTVTLLSILSILSLPPLLSHR